MTAQAWATHTVRVDCGRPVKMLSAVGAGDALNPSIWTLELAANSSVRWTVLAVSAVSDQIVDLALLEPLRGALIVHRVGASLLRLPSELRAPAPRTADFRGMLAARTPQRRQSELRDLKNDLFGTGALVVGADGDYATEGLVPMLRKLILRRLSTMPGAFFHLPDWGMGLVHKGLIFPGDIATLEVKIRDTVLEEPELDRADVAVELARNGVLTIKLRCYLRAGGDPVALSINSTPAAQ